MLVVHLELGHDLVLTIEALPFPHVTAERQCFSKQGVWCSSKIHHGIGWQRERGLSFPPLRMHPGPFWFTKECYSDNSGLQGLGDAGNCHYPTDGGFYTPWHMGAQFQNGP